MCLAADAPEAAPAGRYPACDHAVALLQSLNLPAYLLDDAGALVTHHDRQPQAWIRSLHYRQIGMAETARADADQYFARPDLRRRQFLHYEPRPRCLQHCSTHGKPPPPLGDMRTLTGARMGVLSLRLQTASVPCPLIPRRGR